MTTQMQKLPRQYVGPREKDAKKIRSRHAAQSRRILENTEFESLASVLPIPKAISSNLLDKASVIRLATSFFKLHRLSVCGRPSWTEDQNFGNAPFHHQYIMNQFREFDSQMGSRILEAVDGFLLCLSENGTILYVSETVSIGLGLSQIEMVGNRIFDYVHFDDLDIWHSFLSASHFQLAAFDEPLTFTPAKLVTRFKSSLVKRATKDSKETSLGFKVVEFYLAPRLAQVAEDGQQMMDQQHALTGGYIVGGYAGYALPLLCSATPECRLDGNAFVITTLLDFRIHYVDSRAEEILLGTKAMPIRGVSVYAFVHGTDLPFLVNFHKEVLKLGSSTSGFFRLMNAKGGCTWAQANGVRVNRVRARQSQCSIIAMLCYAIGTDEWDTDIMAEHQLHNTNEQPSSWRTATEGYLQTDPSSQGYPYQQ